MSLPRLSHKDYVFIADIIASLRGPGFPTIAILTPAQQDAVAAHFADAFRGTNSAFSRDRFIAAATGQPYSRRDVQQ